MFIICKSCVDASRCTSQRVSAYKIIQSLFLHMVVVCTFLNGLNTIKTRNFFSRLSLNAWANCVSYTCPMCANDTGPLLSNVHKKKFIKIHFVSINIVYGTLTWYYCFNVASYQVLLTPFCFCTQVYLWNESPHCSGLAWVTAVNSTSRSGFGSLGGPIFVGIRTYT